MSEREPGRQSPVVEVEIGGIALKLTYMNTCLFSFRNPYDQDYSHMDHVWAVQGEDSFCAYDSPELFQGLDEAGFPHVRSPYPDQGEIDLYVSYMTENLDDEKI